MTSSKPIDIDGSFGKLRTAVIVSLASVYCLILIGGIVRSTGSGMGCPDWPKCFGSWVPPTSESDLPPNYKEIYGAKLKGEVVFNANKTWTEYLNRLFGVLTGFFILSTFIFSIPKLKKADTASFLFAGAAFVLVGIQGWLGAKVVASELHPVMVTVHMLLAIIIVFVLLALYLHITTPDRERIAKEKKKEITVYALGAIFISLVQVFLGTQVREAVDAVALKLGQANRSQWVDNLGNVFFIHRSFSIIVLIVNAMLIRQLMNRTNKGLRSLGSWIATVVLAEVLIGIAMAYAAIPQYLQPLHLVLSIVLLGLQFIVWGKVRQTISEVTKPGLNIA